MRWYKEWNKLLGMTRINQRQKAYLILDDFRNSHNILTINSLVDEALYSLEKVTNFTYLRITLKNLKLKIWERKILQGSLNEGGSWRRRTSDEIEELYNPQIWQHFAEPKMVTTSYHKAF